MCVTPSTRSQAWADNTQAAARRSPNGGAYGPDTCIQGYVWREASPSDHVCVTVATRAQAAYDNSRAVYRTQCDCGSSYLSCEQQWFGTAPFCNGGCPSDWDFVRSSSRGGSCDQSKAGLCIYCSGTFGNSCIFGSKALCQNCLGTIREG